MRKWFTGSLAVLTFLVLVSAVYAHFPGRGSGFNCRQFADADIEKVKQFQKETLPLRDEMVFKRLEIRKELHKETPDRDRIAEIKKEMIDIRTQIMKKADESELSPQCRKGFRQRSVAKNDGMGFRPRPMRGY